ncbi:MAG: galactose mutarotase [Desulfobacterales bacterium]|nr:galactose mutarotase [Desulfobacterales bacterium]
MKKVAFFLTCVLFAACVQTSNKSGETVKLPVDPANFDTIVDGKNVALYTLTNENGMVLQLTNYGARIVSLLTPDKDGNMGDIVLGYSNIEGYLNDGMYQGCIVGRYANRIKEGKFTLDEQEYSLFVNNGPNTLHGGKKGFDKVVWDAEVEENKITFTYVSPDMEEGYPGTLTVKHSMELTIDNKIIMMYEATTDKNTVVNLSNHSYWNLLGEGKGDILDHTMQIIASNTTPVDSTLIPTGEIAPVEGTPFDFRTGEKIGTHVNDSNDQLTYGGGYDHNWVLDKEEQGALELALRLSEESTGRIMEIWTTEPAMQFYGGNFMDGTVKGKAGLPYNYRSAVVVEPQHYPDSPNHPSFPSTVLKPGEKYTHKSVYKFKVEKQEEHGHDHDHDHDHDHAH